MGKPSLWTCLAFVVVLFAAAAHRLAHITAVVRDPGPAAPLRRAVRNKPHDGALQADLALALLKPSAEAPPTAPADSFYGDELVIGHPNAAEARQAMEAALRLAPGRSETHLAHQAVLMTEGKAEEAIQPGRRAVELAPGLAHGYVELARSHLASACAQGCRARNEFREEKLEERRTGKKSALEQREAEQKQQYEKQQAAKAGGGDGATQGQDGKAWDRNTMRAGAHWRVTEAGKLLQQAAATEPRNKPVKRLAKAAKKMTELDGFKVLSTEQVFQHGQCEVFIGKELDGAVCDKRRHKFE